MKSPHLRTLGDSELQVSPVGFGCWPISGVSSLGVNDRDSLATIHAAIDAGINFIDTAYSYGYDGEADRLLAQVLKTRRSEVVVASKVGQHFAKDHSRVIDARPDTLRRHAQEELQRLSIDQLDLLYLHTPDPEVPLTESAAAIQEIVHEGLARYAGVSNVDGPQLVEFHLTCPVIAVQPPFNMLQPNEVDGIRDFCLANRISVVCYWALMKGLLAGKMHRDHQFEPNDRRLSYAIYQGDAWEHAQDLLDLLRELANELQCTVAQLVIAWTIHQPVISVALCGAKRPEQITETAAAMRLDVRHEHMDRIDLWLKTRREASSE
jgi:aryl-alcohol dehydrogenase-like predicted oxidoreductase